MIKRYLLIDQWTKNFALLAAAVFATGVFFGIQLTLFNNFIVTRLEIEPHHLGYVEALREVPGFLNVLFIALMMRMAVPKLAGISLIVMGLGNNRLCAGFFRIQPGSHLFHLEPWISLLASSRANYGSAVFSR